LVDHSSASSLIHLLPVNGGATTQEEWSESLTLSKICSFLPGGPRSPRKARMAPQQPSLSMAHCLFLSSSNPKQSVYQTWITGPFRSQLIQLWFCLTVSEGLA
jgi:hypothetical protein